jgi:hypothetical protein
MATNDAAALSLTLFSVSCPGPAPASRLRQMLIAHLRPVLQPCLRSTRPASQRRRPRPSPTTPLRSRRSTRTGAQTPLSASTRPRPGARAPTRTRARSGPSASSSNSSQPGRRRVACVASLPAAQPPSSTEHSTPPFVTCFSPSRPSALPVMPVIPSLRPRRVSPPSTRWVSGSFPVVVVGAVAPPLPLCTASYAASIDSFSSARPTLPSRRRRLLVHASCSR